VVGAPIRAGCTWLRPSTVAALVASVFYGISSLAPIAGGFDDILRIQINPRILQLHCVHRNDRR
jgi:hypothetical protein